MSRGESRSACRFFSRAYLLYAYFVGGRGGGVGISDSLWFFLHCLIDNNARGAGRLAQHRLHSRSARSVFCLACGVCVIFLNTHTQAHIESRCIGYCPVRECVVVRAASAKKGPKKLRLKNVVRTNCHLCLFFSFLHAQRANVGLCAMHMHMHMHLCVCVCGCLPDKLA